MWNIFLCLATCCTNEFKKKEYLKIYSFDNFSYFVADLHNLEKSWTSKESGSHSSETAIICILKEQRVDSPRTNVCKVRYETKEAKEILT